jgi:hypothetical protein
LVLRWKRQTQRDERGGGGEKERERERRRGEKGSGKGREGEEEGRRDGVGGWRERSRLGSKVSLENLSRLN